MGAVKGTVHWVSDLMHSLSDQQYTGTVTIRFSQGGIQGASMNQELHPRQQPVAVRLQPVNNRDYSQIDT